MSKTVAIKQYQLGQGRSHICVPIVDQTAQDILASASLIAKSTADVVEWRADHFNDVFHLGKVMAVLDQLRQMLPDQLLLFTFRSLKEGGHRSIAPDDYEMLCKNVCMTGWADLLDIELSMGTEVVQSLLGHARENGVHSILSEHHFDCTPPLDEMMQTLLSMDQQQPDFAKLAVMPSAPQEVIDLLSVTCQFSANPDHCAVITMSMGQVGQISRVAGSLTGSALTFATLGQCSAPGQLSLDTVKNMLDILG